MNTACHGPQLARPFWRPLWDPFWDPFWRPLRTGSPQLPQIAWNWGVARSWFGSRQGGGKA
jgi:hypothetical protein